MALFLDSADLEEIRSAMEFGIYSGVTTNPSLLKGLDPEDWLERYASIAKICRKSLYLQVDWGPVAEMKDQALTLVEVAPGRTVIKVPIAPEGLRLCQELKEHGVPVCVTAVFTPAQAYAAASARAHAVAIYVGRLNRRGDDGLGVVRETSRMFRAGELSTSIIAASIPDVDTLVPLLSVPGVDATIPYRLQESILHDKGTLEAIEEFAGSSSR